MPRRNNREVYEPLDLTPSDVRSPLWDDQNKHLPDPETGWRLRTERERERLDRQKTARANRGIDWSVCLVPGCGEELFNYGRLIHPFPPERDHTVALPLCYRHLAVAHQQANNDINNELLVDASARVLERKQERQREMHENDKALRAADTVSGDIYFVRLNGLIKVGWSRDVNQRLRAYGPDVEVMCIYPASRDDETLLHRQLRPVLAKGREWYQECQLVVDFADRAIAEHGAPTWSDGWTSPRPVVASKRVK